MNLNRVCELGSKKSKISLKFKSLIFLNLNLNIRDVQLVKLANLKNLIQNNVILNCIYSNNIILITNQTQNLIRTQSQTWFFWNKSNSNFFKINSTRSNLVPYKLKQAKTQFDLNPPPFKPIYFERIGLVHMVVVTALSLSLDQIYRYKYTFHRIILW